MICSPGASGAGAGFSSAYPHARENNRQAAAFLRLVRRLEPSRPEQRSQLLLPTLTAALLSGGGRVPSAPDSRARSALLPAFPSRPPGVSFLRSRLWDSPPLRAFLPAAAPRSPLPSLSAHVPEPERADPLWILLTTPPRPFCRLPLLPPASPLPNPLPSSTLAGSALPQSRSFHTNFHSTRSSLTPFKLQGKSKPSLFRSNSGPNAASPRRRAVSPSCSPLRALQTRCMKDFSSCGPVPSRTKCSYRHNFARLDLAVLYDLLSQGGSNEPHMELL
ncbi:uncharacterized protein LOC122177463 [Lagopus leucura]|uniref:uncharacterized protein LOC122177463 n=1 Tax=Lagopus leucura TaxID=30410 RepID=UPI001C668D16|nr:uncharacterized protein LOC122177463 [Lagopus leucura]